MAGRWEGRPTSEDSFSRGVTTMAKRHGKKTVRSGRKPAKSAAQAKAAPGGFKLTYATMFDPPASMHEKFDKALAAVKANLGRDYSMWIGGKERQAAERFEDRSPINSKWVLGTFQKGTAKDVADALAAARTAFPTWSGMKWQERVRLLRRVVAQIEKRVYELAAAVALEVGKNRMEALGDVQEAADLIAYNCDALEKNNGFVRPQGRDPLRGYRATNVSVLRPHGV
jgi:1-pyrroline-5-carboxylate dehydrogenase